MGLLAQPQVGDGDEVGRCPEAFGSALGLPHLAVHGLDESVAAVIEHVSHHRVEASLQGGYQSLERFESAAASPGQQCLQLGTGRLGVVVHACVGKHLAQRHLQLSSARSSDLHAAASAWPEAA